MGIIASIQERIIHPWEQNHFEKTKYGKRIAAYQNKYENGRCFIVANGPSLRVEDLNILHEQKEITFAMNRIYKIFGKTSWRPDFYVCEDELIIKGQQSIVNNINSKEKFIPIELKWWHGIEIEDACYFHINYYQEKQSPYSFSKNCAHQIDCRGTVTFTCIQLAVYMGFTNIYLLGVDHNYRVTIDENGNVIENPEQNDYFCDGYDDNIIDKVVHNIGNNTRAYQDAQTYCKSISGKHFIYNATRGGRLEVFPRVDFDSLF